MEWQNGKTSYVHRLMWPRSTSNFICFYEGRIKQSTFILKGWRCVVRGRIMRCNLSGWWCFGRFQIGYTFHWWYTLMIALTNELLRVWNIDGYLRTVALEKDVALSQIVLLLDDLWHLSMSWTCLTIKFYHLKYNATTSFKFKLINSLLKHLRQSIKRIIRIIPFLNRYIIATII